MSEASKLIERMERETGQRVDDNDFDNDAMSGLLGALSRALGHSPSTYKERDDVAAGLLIKHRMSPEYEREQAKNELIATLLANGMDPKDLI